MKLMAIEIVREYFKTLGIDDQIQEFEQSSATVELAAKAVGTEPARICKTLSFEIPEGGCIIIQTAGDTKLKNGKFKRKFGFKAKMLSPDDVIKYTGHAIGGVCAFGIDRSDVKIYADTSLQRFDTVFPACGSSNSAIELTCDDLFKISKALEWVDVCDIIEPSK